MKGNALFGKPIPRTWLIMKITIVLAISEGHEPLGSSIDDDADSSPGIDSPASWDAISADSSDPESLPPPPEAPDIDPAISEYLSYIRTSLDHLARMSLAIRKAGNKYRYEKADEALDEAAFQDFHDHLAKIILRAIGDDEAEAKTWSSVQKVQRVSDYTRLNNVQKRLIQANILRKHRIEFFTTSRKTDKRPIQRNTGLLKAQPQSDEARALATSSVAGSRSSQLRHDPLASPPPMMKEARVAPAPSVTDTKAPTATDVGSRLNVKGLISGQTPSNVTNLTRIGAKQTYPGCPKHGPDGSLRCPYCHDILPSSYSKSKEAWR